MNYKNMIKAIDILKEYESLTFDERVSLLTKNSQIVNKDSSSKTLVKHFCLCIATEGCCTTYKEFDIISSSPLYNKIYPALSAATDYIRSIFSMRTLKVEDRKELIKWIENRLVDKFYWEDGPLKDFKKNYSFTLIWHRYYLIQPMIAYTRKQVEELGKVNDLFIEAGTQLFHKVKALNKMLDEWKKDTPDLFTAHYLDLSFTKHQGTPFEQWLAKQLGSKREGGSENWGDNSCNHSKPEGYIYMESEEKEPKCWHHWDEGLNRERVENIPICYLYHDLWGHQQLIYSFIDIIRIKEVRVNTKIKFDYTEEEQVWNE